MVDKWGMANFFLTLTADETAELKWLEVRALEDKLATDFREAQLDWRVGAGIALVAWWLNNITHQYM